MSATIDSSPEAAVDALWSQLRHRFTLARSVLSPVFVFGGADRVLTDLHDRLRNVAQLECWPFLECAPAEAADSIVMRLLLSGEPIAWRMVWIDLRVAASGHRPSVLSLMARLNERRGELERRPAVVVFLLPQGWEPQVAAAAPDLWHVRQASVAVPFDAASPPASQPIEGGAEASAQLDPVRLAPAVERYRGQRRQPGAHVSLWDGLFAVDEALAAGLDDAAREIAAEVLEQAQARVSSLSDAGALRDLSLALNRVGDVALARGDLAGAQSAYGRSLETTERLIAGYGENWEALRDLSVSLNRVGDVALARGNLAEAQSAFGRSLETRERLIATYGENREALDDLAYVHGRLALVDGAGRAAKGSSHRQQARALLTRLTMAFPDIAEYRERLDELDQQDAEVAQGAAP